MNKKKIILLGGVIAIIAGVWVIFNKSAQAPAYVDNIDIKELGVRIWVPESLKDLRYVIPGDSGTIANLSTVSLESLANQKGQNTCEVGNAPLGSITVVDPTSRARIEAEPAEEIVLGDKHILYYTPQSTCSNDKDVQALASAQLEAMRQAVKSAKLISVMLGTKTYVNTEYGFSFEYPADTWQVSENKTIPVINVYKKNETAKPPFGIHSTTTNIAIYPQGLGTEGPMSETRNRDLAFAGVTTTAIDFLLKDGSVWATFVPVKNAPKSKVWSEYAFVWASVKVDNERITCVNQGRELPVGQCDYGVEFIGTTYNRYGTMDTKDKEVEDQILKSFKFLN